LLTRAIDERPKPNGERIPQFRDSARESLELELFSTEPIYDDYEILRLTDSLTDFASQFGADDPIVQKVLAGKSPHARAVELVSGTKLKDVAVRKDLYGKDAAALQAAHDPMIDLARLIDGPARDARKIYDAQDEIKKQAYSEIAKARFAIEGAGGYPDATFTLRLSYGTVRGYEQDGKQIPAFTDFAGLYQRSAEHDNKPPFDLPQRWVYKKTNLNLATHFNFVSDADIIGGNSGYHRSAAEGLRCKRARRRTGGREKIVSSMRSRGISSFFVRQSRRNQYREMSRLPLDITKAVQWMLVTTSKSARSSCLLT
jgi:hypothetical protein